MFSAYRKEQRSLINERASLQHSGRVQWKVRCRGEQSIQVGERAEDPALGGESGIEMRTESQCSGKSFSYIRGGFSLSPSECEGIVSFGLQIGLGSAEGVVFIVSLFEDPGFNHEVVSLREPVHAGDSSVLLSRTIDFSLLPTRGAPLFGFFQLCLPTNAGAVVSVGRAFATPVDSAKQAPKLRIRFEVLGDETKASSRLRVWKFVELLRQDSQEVCVGGELDEVDVLICQKVRPFDTVAAVRRANPRAVVVYDFDDNFTLEEEGILPEFLAFINYVDVVTCGSQYLAERVRRWHSNVYVLENPLDLQNQGLFRKPRGELAKIGWFGAPEGLMELAQAGLNGCVTTITRGGDIEFDLRTIDHELTRFDLLLFPVQETPWNLAKNANRMMKALGLGVPVLVSDTPEQKRIAALAGLPPECLVKSSENWAQAIERLRSSYSDLEKASLRAREILWKTHSPQAILGGLLDHLDRSTQSAPRPRKSSSPVFKEIAVLLVDGSPEGRSMISVTGSAVNWKDFHSIHLLSAKPLKNEKFSFSGSNFSIVDGDFFAVFEAADQVIAECDAQFLLILPAGVALAYGFAKAVEEVLRHSSVVLFTRNEFYLPHRIGELQAMPLRELFLRSELPGPLLCSTKWARSRGKSWQSTYELWPWVALIHALAADTPVAVVELPFAFDAAETTELNVSKQYAAWLAAARPEVVRELPSSSNQWGRLLIDIASEAASQIKVELPSIVAHLYSRHVLDSAKIANLEKEIRSLKRKLRS